jgi:clan AA aspartic protease
MKRKLTIKGKINMGLTRIEVTLKSRGSSKRTYRDQFLVDTGATDSMAPAKKLRSIGIKPVGERAYELADGTMQRYEFGLADISFLNEITAGRVVFGPDAVEPILGVTALESAGITVDPTNQTLRWLPAIPLK